MTPSQPPVLASDLDGTLIPLRQEEPFLSALKCIEQSTTTASADPLYLIFVTGRHLASVEHAMDEEGLPLPAAIVCDVGTSYYERSAAGAWVLNEAYRAHLGGLTGEATREQIETLLAQVDGLRLQEAPKQGAYKISYYCDESDLEQVRARVQARLDEKALPFEVLASVDPFTHDGLIDVLPKGVNKAYAIEWLASSGVLGRERLVYAGDSGNDLAVFESSVRSIVVDNTPESIKAHLRKAYAAKCERGGLYFAQSEATAGVLEGCKHFGLIS